MLRTPVMPAIRLEVEGLCIQGQAKWWDPDFFLKEKIAREDAWNAFTAQTDQNGLKIFLQFKTSHHPWLPSRHGFPGIF